MTTLSPSTLQDEWAIRSLGASKPAGVPIDWSLFERQSKHLTPSSSPSTRKICFDMVHDTDGWHTFENSRLQLSVKLLFEQALTKSPNYPVVAFKSSALSIFNRLVVTTATGTVLIDESDPMTLAAHLRLIFEKDEDWVKSIAPAIHYSRDRPANGCVGLRSLDEIDVPNISKYTAAPIAGATNADNNFENPAYNQGFHERRNYLVAACHNEIGQEADYQGTEIDWGTVSKQLIAALDIPLSSMSDFFRVLCGAGPVVNDRYKFEFHLAQDAFVPVTLGATHVAAGVNVRAPGLSVKLSVDETMPIRLHYESIKFRKEANDLAVEALLGGMERELMWRNFEVQHNEVTLKGKKHGDTVNYRVSGGAVLPQKVYVLVYPADKVGTIGWPSVLATGPNGLTKANIKIGSNNYYQNTVDTLSDHYENLLNASRIGSDSLSRECGIPFNDFKFVSRIMCFDISRHASTISDPNAPVQIMLNGTVQTAEPDADGVDIVVVLETLKSGVKHYSSGTFQWKVTDALVADQKK